MSKKQKANIIGIYHKDCIDGTTAAAVLLKKFPHVKLFPLKHYRGEKDIKNILNSTNKKTIVYIVDFSLTPQELGVFTAKAAHVINIDHHIGVKERLEHLQDTFSNYTFVFDNTRSGASLTWLHLFKKKIPRIIRYVEENDIHKGSWRDDQVQYTISYLAQFVNNPEKIKKFISDKKAIRSVLSNGKILTDANDKLVTHALESYKPINIKIGKHSVLSYNPPEFLRSRLGHILSKKHKKAVNIFAINGAGVRLHFRSQNNQKPSALDLACALGGNGHRNAAGAHIPLKKFIRLIK